MSLAGEVKYHANVSLLGHGFLRYVRWRGEWRLRRPGARRHEHLAAPLRCSPWLRELIARHYLKGRWANLTGKVAWVTSGAPVEALEALGYFLLYPENHGAVCGIRRSAEGLCAHAEAAGYSPDLCSYARTDIGSALSGETPVGRLPRPDLLLCCTNICQTVLYWYQVLAHHFGVPLVLIDTPFVYAEVAPHAVEYVKRQIEESVAEAERVAGRSLSWHRLGEITRQSKEAVELWLQVLQTAKHRPAPITAFDEFIHMAPIVEMRGKPFTVAYYRRLLAELQLRVAHGRGALRRERRRLVWDNLPIWPRVRWLAERLAARGVALVASTYTNAWGELAPLIDADRPLESAARVHLNAILNRGTGHKLEVMRRLVQGYGADGVILHSDRSCKPYSIGQIDQREKLARDHGIPALLLEADHNDPRVFSEEQAASRLDAFLELIGA
ncbi:MAG: 2-hydroxyacyl-CoA dehydratase [Deltaproteobacteria bacterium]|nr:2-hydroxyacyl-CoA dehydratase [Deltaproteobacteria bacterium]